jgi:hypothetical protein
MTATTHRGITYTGTGTYTITADLDLPLIAGVDQDDTTWLTDYPGALTSFAARQSDGANRMQPRLLCLTLSAALADTNTLTLSGDVNAILSTQVSAQTTGVSSVKVTTSGLVCTFECESTADGTTDSTGAASLWLIVA